MKRRGRRAARRGTRGKRLRERGSGSFFPFSPQRGEGVIAHSWRAAAPLGRRTAVTKSARRASPATPFSWPFNRQFYPPLAGQNPKSKMPFPSYLSYLSYPVTQLLSHFVVRSLSFDWPLGPWSPACRQAGWSLPHPPPPLPGACPACPERSRGERAQRVERVPPCSLIPIPSLS